LPVIRQNSINAAMEIKNNYLLYHYKNMSFINIIKQKSTAIYTAQMKLHPNENYFLTASNGDSSVKSKCNSLHNWLWLVGQLGFMLTAQLAEHV